MKRYKVYDLANHKMMYSDEKLDEEYLVSVEDYNINFAEYLARIMNDCFSSFITMECSNVYDRNNNMISESDIVRYYTNETEFVIGKIIKKLGTLFIE